MEKTINSYNGNEIAVIGMSGRFPKANSIEELWEQLKEGKECIVHYDEETLIKSGIDKSLVKQKNYIKAKGELSDIELFDAAFFNINPKDAELMDPQHRMMLECAWHTFEHAGYNPLNIKESVGVFTGKSMSSYLFLNIYPQIKKVLAGGNLQAAIGNDKDSIPTTISYHLDLKGPSLAVQSSSSTSLTAICVACQSLLTYQCDMALAGGITAGPPINSGYIYDVGGIMAKDGHNRSFDKDSSGFVPGSGYGQVLLKRLEDAVNDGDYIWGVIKGFTVNNDGHHKISYTAPSANAQTELIIEAHAVAGIHPEQVSYIEAHGTGTRLGDPIELKGLTKAFRYKTDKLNYCAVGSIKSNIGHLDSAAGVAGFIKTILSLHYKQIPPSINYNQPNPEMDIENSPFFINTELQDWEGNDGQRFAGVTSLGMGGTNAHVVLQDFNNTMKSMTSKENKILLISAKTTDSLEKNSANLLNYLKNNNNNFPLEDIAYTYAVGREHFLHRRAIVCKTKEEAIEKLENNQYLTDNTRLCNTVSKPVVFVFSPSGSEYIGMGKDLYEKEIVYYDSFNQCAEVLQPLIKKDLKTFYLNTISDDEENSLLEEQIISQALLFSFEYATAKLLISKGITPAALIGHGFGEYVATILSEIFTLEEGLKLLVTGLKYMKPLGSKAMLAVYTSERSVEELLIDTCKIVAVNSQGVTIIYGTYNTIKASEEVFEKHNIKTERITEGFFIPKVLQNKAVSSLKELLKSMELKSPKIPVVSTIIGKRPSDEQIKSENFWIKAITERVAFSKGISTLINENDYQFLEIGAENVLSKYIQQISKLYKDNTEWLSVVNNNKLSKSESIIDELALLWLKGVRIDWTAYYALDTRGRLPLPTYAFSHRRYWIPSEYEKAVGIQGSSDLLNITDVKRGNQQEVAQNDNRPKLPNDFKAPQTDIEIKITQIWEELLSIKPVGINDNFFDLNGHSLLATQILSRISEFSNIELPMESIFESQTIAELAKTIEEELKNKGDDTNELADLLMEIDKLSLEETKKKLNRPADF